MPTLETNTYGKTGIRLTQVLREGGRHDVIEMSVSVLFEGDFEESYSKPDNAKVLPTDTIKNTVYVVARRNPIQSIESFAQDIAQHFLNRVPHLDNVKIEIAQTVWSRIYDGDNAFVRAGLETRIAELWAGRIEHQAASGIDNLEILKTAHSAFTGYLRDDLTTLPETRDRLLGTAMNARWTYGEGVVDDNTTYAAIRRTLLAAFAGHHSESVQHTLYYMAEAVLTEIGAVNSIRITMPNKHRLLADLSRFDLDNPNRIFVPTDEPSGYIEARLRRA